MTDGPSAAKLPFAAGIIRKPLAIAILAAGESRRMGSPKALLPFGGKTFLEHLLAVTHHPRVGVTRVVLGAGAEVIRDTLKLDAGLMVLNPDWGKGQLSSIHAAIRSLPVGGTEGIILCPVDHPLVSEALVAQLIETFDESASPIALPTFRGRRGHPTIFRASLYHELLDASLDVGARQVVWAHAREVVEVATKEKGVVLNLNDRDALARAQEDLN
jgi:molybdenum cofactor cytidylyltransferase